jgi:hypothetical protein
VVSQNGPAAYADLTRWAADLRAASESVGKESEAILDETALAVETFMKEFAPKRTGRLYMSIRTVKNPGRREIGAQGVPYDVFQEFGTATRGEFGGTEYIIRPRTEGGRLHFQVNGKWVSAREVHHPGIPPHPFARPAARQALTDIEQKYAIMGADLLLRGRDGYRRTTS